MLSRKSSLIKHLDFLILDLLILELAFLIGMLLRDPSLVYSRAYRNVAVSIPFIGFFVSAILHSYSGILRRDHKTELRQVLVQVCMVAAIETVFLFLVQYAEILSRLFFLYFVLSAVALIYAGRLCLKAFVRKRKTSPRQSIFLITTSALARKTIQNLHVNNFDNFDVRALILTDTYKAEEEIFGVPVVCGARKAREHIQKNWVDAVFVHLPAGSNVIGTASENADEWLSALYSFCEGMGIPIIQTLSGISLFQEEGDCDDKDGIDRGIKNLKIVRIGPYAALICNPYFSSFGQICAKRLLDIVGGIVGTVITGLFVLVIGPLIYIASPGNIFFTQTRIGRNGKKFKLYKFRSMVPDAEEQRVALMDSNKMSGPMFKVDNDPRIIGSGPDGTRHGIGWFIRTFSIDEFPQFFNVLKGDMSLVGTRPPTVDEWEKYEPHHRARVAVRPGITGLWQVSGRSKIEDFEEVVRLDTEYIRDWSVGWDILILLKTIWVVFQRIGAE